MHKLFVPTNGQPEYHRQAFDIDCQAGFARDIKLVGAEEISKQPAAVMAILAFERDIVYGSLTNWENYRSI